MLSQNIYDLIYFSTTEFPICTLGAHWKRKFNIPYVIDMQDPWFTDYYLRQKKERPKKYWFTYHLHKYLEPIAMASADGLISVSAKYIETLKERYPVLLNKPTAIITFGISDLDFKIAEANHDKLKLHYKQAKDRINLVYVGRGGFDMKDAATILFSNFKIGLVKEPDLFKKVNFHFIGTSYAPKDTGVQTLKPIADDLEIGNHVTEHTNRIGFYEVFTIYRKQMG